MNTKRRLTELERNAPEVIPLAELCTIHDAMLLACFHHVPGDVFEQLLTGWRKLNEKTQLLPNWLFSRAHAFDVVLADIAKMIGNDRKRE